MLNGLVQSRNTTKDKRSTKSTPNNQKMAIGTYISMITSNVNGLNAPTKKTQTPTKKHKMDTKTRPHFRPKDTYRLKVRGWKNIFLVNGKHKKDGVAILISDKMNLKED